MRSTHKSAVKSVVELVVTVAVAIGLALLIQAFIVKPYRIPSPSMVPTLIPGQRILTNRLINHPSIGDVVVFHPPHGADNEDNPVCGNPNQGTNHPQACDEPTSTESSQTFVKRVVAGPGDTMYIRDGHVYLNGVREKDSYTLPCGDGSECNFPKPITIPPGDYFMMGDNRGESDDSRFWGPVPDKWIIGVAFFTYWPPDRIGTL
ncbi:MAG: signal peptidase I [Solirubrobacteraceae bacterium]